MLENYDDLEEERLAGMFSRARAKGYSPYEIACAYGCTRDEVKHYLAIANESLETKNLKKLRRLEVEKLNQLEAIAMRAAVNEQGHFNQQATKSIISIMQQRARILGMNAPSKMALTSPSGKREANGNVMFYIPSNGRDDPSVIGSEQQT